jgi:general secretion pathway protein G
MMKFPIKNGQQTQHHENPCSPYHCEGFCLYSPNPAWCQANPYQAGLTLIELIIVIAIIATLAGIALPSYSTYVDRAYVARAIQDIQVIQNEIIAYNIDNGNLPADLSDINMDSRLDPWGNPYQYTNFDLVPKGKWRKDKFLVPINSAFDLWSMGPDGKSVPPLTAKSSQDDIIRANDGNFIGRAKLY